MTGQGSVGGVPILFATKDFGISLKGCRDGLVDHHVTDADGEELTWGSTWDYGTGRYDAAVDALGRVGLVRITLSFWCPTGKTPADIAFDAYVESSGVVTDTQGTPLKGATVTLQRDDGGSYQDVPDGDASLGPASPDNPRTTATDGSYHWNPAAGRYRATASKPGCTDPDDGSASVTGAHFEPGMPKFPALVLSCGEGPVATTTKVSVASPLGMEARREGELVAEVSSAVGTPNGTVDFTADGVALPGCTHLPVEDGSAQCGVTFPSAMSTQIRADYSGSHGHAASTGRLALDVGRTIPELTYGDQPTIRHGQKVSAVDLGLSADVPGDFRIDADPDLVLPAGYQPLGFTFVPSDLTQYRPVSDQITVFVEDDASPAPAPSATSTPSPTPSPTPTRKSARTSHGSGKSPTLDSQTVADLSTPSARVSTRVSTTGGDRLLVAFVSLDSPSCETQDVRRISGGLTWTRVARTTSGPRTGAAEVWTARAPSRLANAEVTAHLRHPGDASLAVVAFAGAADLGAISTRHGTGPTSVSLTPHASGSQVWASGHYADAATAVTAGSGDRILHQRANTRIEDTYWLQRSLSPTREGHAVTVTAHGPAEATWQSVAVEITPAG